ncbi:triosephosphate isomerase [Clostridia bacterium]|nr:triosephosphate isomerase [Clostridia bacterium]
MPKTIMAANWKMNMTNSEAKAFIKEFKEKVEGLDNGVQIVICAPFTALAKLAKKTRETNIAIGAENMYFEEKGAYTGEISAAMLVDIGVQYVILGHSERRTIFGESDELINKKVKQALNTGLTPIICVGENLEERKADKVADIVCNQVRAAFAGLTSDEAAKCVVAYEPIWAIGTGEVATPEQANEACGMVRSTLSELYGAEMAENATIQYGGSMNGSNAAELVAREHINGGLIGGAALKVDEFTKMIESVK